MNEADRILKMIEGVDPSDTDTLDEIDARLWCVLKGYCFFKTYQDWNSRPTIKYTLKQGGVIFAQNSFPKYTRSLDAIKAVEEADLEGWKLYKIYRIKDEYVCSLFLNVTIINSFLTARDTVLSHALPTEHLARLHAIIQALYTQATG